eukprot:2437349-Rhodomonas_salina.2
MGGPPISRTPRKTSSTQKGIACEIKILSARNHCCISASQRGGLDMCYRAKKDNCAGSDKGGRREKGGGQQIPNLSF